MWTEQEKRVIFYDIKVRAKAGKSMGYAILSLAEETFTRHLCVSRINCEYIAEIYKCNPQDVVAKATALGVWALS